MNEARIQKVRPSEKITKTKVKNTEGEEIGVIKDLMIDLSYGNIACAVLQFGGVIGLGDKYFAVPWDALVLDTVENSFILDLDKKFLENAQGFEKNNWPDMANYKWSTEIYEYYGYTPYWL